MGGKLSAYSADIIVPSRKLTNGKHSYLSIGLPEQLGEPCVHIIRSSSAPPRRNAHHKPPIISTRRHRASLRCRYVLVNAPSHRIICASGAVTTSLNHNFTASKHHRRSMRLYNPSPSLITDNFGTLPKQRIGAIRALHQNEKVHRVQARER